jgi:Protein of unknown function (DUF3795)
MNEIISRCGFRCDECPAFAGNNRTFADQLKTATGWSRYFGIKMSPDKIRCNGCPSNDCAEYDLPDSECPIRRCVVERGMNTCADCFDYPCTKLQKRMKSVDEAISRFKGKITEEEYDAFIAPYDFRKTLGEIRDRRTDRID